MIAIRRHLQRSHSHEIQWPIDADPLGELPPGDDTLHLVGEVTVLRQKKVQIGMAAIVAGGIDRRTCAEIRIALGKLADYVSYANWGPLIVVAFQHCLFEQLKPMWRELLAATPGACAGVAFPGDAMDTRELVLAARLALRRAIESNYELVAFDEEESLTAVAGHRASGERRRCGGNAGRWARPAMVAQQIGTGAER